MSNWIWIIPVLLVGISLIVFLVGAAVLYRILLVRSRPEKWGRECSMPEDEEYLAMYEEGLKWGERYAAFRREVTVASDGLKLCGEYFDFGHKKAVIIIPGRTEACLYSYFFSEPYRVSGYNVLVIDNRAHGFSQGKYCSFGVHEHRDILTWGRLLHDELGNESVVLHGICIGASVALYTLTCDRCPDYFRGITADGMFTTFYESFKNHMIEDKRPVFPLSILVAANIRVFAGANVVTDGPIRLLPMLKKPILFLHSREDAYSLPDKTQELYDLCTAEKKLVWFEKGAHSRIRANNQDDYDRAIIAFWGNKTN